LSGTSDHAIQRREAIRWTGEESTQTSPFPTSGPVDIEREPAKPSPTDRLENAKNDHLRSLEAQIEFLMEDRQRLLGKVDELRAMVDRLAPENARLREAHANAVVNNILATIFVAVGGGAISFATFVEGSSKAVAWVGAAFLGAGVLILILATLRGRSTTPAQPS
jgi:hypothetical protein